MIPRRDLDDRVKGGGDPRKALGAGRIICNRKEGYSIALRMGDPARAHVLCVTRITYDFHGATGGGVMEPVGFLVSALEVTRGDLYSWLPRLRDILVRAKDRARERNGHVHLTLDLTRAPAAWLEVHRQIAEPMVLMTVTRAPRQLSDSTPWKCIGRFDLLSQLNVSAHRPGALRFALGEGEGERWGDARAREALAKATAAPPVEDGDGLAIEGQADDDAALAIALAVMWGELNRPSPWYPEDRTDDLVKARERATAARRAYWARFGS